MDFQLGANVARFLLRGEVEALNSPEKLRECHKTEDKVHKANRFYKLHLFLISPACHPASSSYASLPFSLTLFLILHFIYSRARNLLGCTHTAGRTAALLETALAYTYVVAHLVPQHRKPSLLSAVDAVHLNLSRLLPIHAAGRPLNRLVRLSSKCPRSGQRKVIARLGC